VSAEEFLGTQQLGFESPFTVVPESPRSPTRPSTSNADCVYSWRRASNDCSIAEYLQMLEARKNTLRIVLETDEGAQNEWHALIAEMDSVFLREQSASPPASPPSQPKQTTNSSEWSPTRQHDTMDESPVHTPSRPVHSPSRSGWEAAGDAGDMPVLGSRVRVDGYDSIGTVLFIGPHESKSGQRFGVQLDEQVGRNDGKVNGHRYFQCEPGYGVLVIPSKVASALAEEDDQQQQQPQQQQCQEVVEEQSSEPVVTEEIIESAVPLATEVESTTPTEPDQEQNEEQPQTLESLMARKEQLRERDLANDEAARDEWHWVISEIDQLVQSQHILQDRSPHSSPPSSPLPNNNNNNNNNSTTDHQQQQEEQVDDFVEVHPESHEADDDITPTTSDNEDADEHDGEEAEHQQHQQDETEKEEEVIQHQRQHTDLYIAPTDERDDEVHDSEDVEGNDDVATDDTTTDAQPQIAMWTIADDDDQFDDQPDDDVVASTDTGNSIADLLQHMENSAPLFGQPTPNTTTTTNTTTTESPEEEEPEPEQQEYEQEQEHEYEYEQEQEQEVQEQAQGHVEEAYAQPQVVDEESNDNEEHELTTWSSDQVHEWLEDNCLDRFADVLEDWTGVELFRLITDITENPLAVDQQFSEMFDMLPMRGRRKWREQWIEAVSVLGLEAIPTPTEPTIVENVEPSANNVTNSNSNSTSYSTSTTYSSGYTASNYSAYTSSYYTNKYKKSSIDHTGKSPIKISSHSYTATDPLPVFEPLPSSTSTSMSTSSTSALSTSTSTSTSSTSTSTSTAQTTEIKSKTIDAPTGIVQDVTISMDVGGDTVTMLNRIQHDESEGGASIPQWMWQQYGNTAIALDFSKGQLTDLSAFSNFNNLQRLSIANNDIASFDTLASAPKLQHLNVADNSLSELLDHVCELGAKVPSLTHLTFGKQTPRPTPPSSSSSGSSPSGSPPSSPTRPQVKSTKIPPKAGCVMMMHVVQHLPQLRVLDDISIALEVPALWRLPMSFWNGVSNYLTGADVASLGSTCTLGRALAKSLHSADSTIKEPRTSVMAVCRTTLPTIKRSIESWPNLNFTLKLYGAVDFPSLSRITQLYELHLIGVTNMVSPSHAGIDLSAVTKRIRFEHCDELIDGKGLEHMDSVTFVECPVLTRINMLNSLQSLEIVECPQFSTNDLIYQLDVVPEIKVKGCSVGAVGQLGGGSVTMSEVVGENVCEWKRAKLALEACPKLRDLKGLASVHTLSLTDCHLIVDVSPLRNVHTLELNNCDRIRDVTALGSCCRVTLRHISRLDNVQVLSACTFVRLEDCHKIADVGALSTVAHLELVNCSNIERVVGDGNSCIRIRDCESLTQVEGFGSVSQVTLAKCDSFNNYATLNGATYLTLSDMTHPLDLSVLDNCTQRVTVDGCTDVSNADTIVELVGCLTIDGKVIPKAEVVVVEEETLSGKEQQTSSDARAVVSKSSTSTLALVDHFPPKLSIATLLGSGDWEVAKRMTEVYITARGRVAAAAAAAVANARTKLKAIRRDSTAIIETDGEGATDTNDATEEAATDGGSNGKVISQTSPSPSKQRAESTPEDGSDTLSDDGNRITPEPEKRKLTLNDMPRLSRILNFSLLRNSNTGAKTQLQDQEETAEEPAAEDVVTESTESDCGNNDAVVTTEEESPHTDPPVEKPPKVEVKFIDPYAHLSEEDRAAQMLVAEQDRREMEDSAAFELFSDLGHQSRSAKQYEVAIAFFFKALAVARRQKGEVSHETGNVYVNLGIVYGQLKNHQKEMEYFKNALPIFQTTLGQKHMHVAMTLNNLGIANRNAKDYNRAMLYFNKALTLYREVLGEDHNETVRTQRNIDRLVTLARSTKI